MDRRDNRIEKAMQARALSLTSADGSAARAVAIKRFPTNTQASAIECRDPLPVLDARLFGADSLASASTSNLLPERISLGVETPFVFVETAPNLPAGGLAARSLGPV